MDYKMSASLIAKNKKWTFDSVFSLDKTKVLITDFVTVSIHGVILVELRRLRQIPLVLNLRN